MAALEAMQGEGKSRDVNPPPKDPFLRPTREKNMKKEGNGGREPGGDENQFCRSSEQQRKGTRA